MNYTNILLETPFPLKKQKKNLGNSNLNAAKNQQEVKQKFCLKIKQLKELMKIANEKRNLLYDLKEQRVTCYNFFKHLIYF